MTGGMRIDDYEWSGGREAMLRFGREPARVVLALPLLEEFNRMRAFGVTLLRALAAKDIGGVLPDWPGTGESLMATNAATLSVMRQAYREFAQTYAPLFAIGVRSGALIDGDAAVRGRWYLSPQGGDELIRELARQTSPEGDIAGNFVSRVMLDQLGGARHREARVVRLESDPREADVKLRGAPLWRRAEPGNDSALAMTLADDIARWIASCGD